MFESLIKYPCGSVMNLEDLAANAGFVNLDIQEWIEIRQNLEKLLKADGRYKIDFSKGNGFVLGLSLCFASYCDSLSLPRKTSATGKSV